MAKHRRPGPPDQPARTASDPLALYEKRRLPPMDEYRRHRPASGGASHLRPEEPRVLEEWDGFAYQAVGAAADLAAARVWASSRSE